MTFFFEDLQNSYLQLRCIDGVLRSAKCFTGRVTDFPYVENKLRYKKIMSVNHMSSNIQ